MQAVSRLKIKSKQMINKQVMFSYYLKQLSYPQPSKCSIPCIGIPTVRMQIEMYA
jgi:hypothetical protein